MSDDLKSQISEIINDAKSRNRKKRYRNLRYSNNNKTVRRRFNSKSSSSEDAFKTNPKCSEILRKILGPPRPLPTCDKTICPYYEDEEKNPVNFAECLQPFKEDIQRALEQFVKVVREKVDTFSSEASRCASKYHLASQTSDDESIGETTTSQNLPIDLSCPDGLCCKCNRPLKPLNSAIVDQEIQEKLSVISTKIQTYESEQFLVTIRPSNDQKESCSFKCCKCDTNRHLQTQTIPQFPFPFPRDNFNGTDGNPCCFCCKSCKCYDFNNKNRSETTKEIGDSSLVERRSRQNLEILSNNDSIDIDVSGDGGFLPNAEKAIFDTNSSKIQKNLMLVVTHHRNKDVENIVRSRKKHREDDQNILSDSTTDSRSFDGPQTKNERNDNKYRRKRRSRSYPNKRHQDDFSSKSTQSRRNASSGSFNKNERYDNRNHQKAPASNSKQNDSKNKRHQKRRKRSYKSISEDSRSSDGPQNNNEKNDKFRRKEKSKAHPNSLLQDNDEFSSKSTQNRRNVSSDSFSRNESHSNRGPTKTLDNFLSNSKQKGSKNKRHQKRRKSSYDSRSVDDSSQNNKYQRKQRSESYPKSLLQDLHYMNDKCSSKSTQSGRNNVFSDSFSRNHSNRGPTKSPDNFSSNSKLNYFKNNQYQKRRKCSYDSGSEDSDIYYYEEKKRDKKNNVIAYPYENKLMKMIKSVIKKSSSECLTLKNITSDCDIRSFPSINFDCEELKKCSINSKDKIAKGGGEEKKKDSNSKQFSLDSVNKRNLSSLDNQRRHDSKRASLLDYKENEIQKSVSSVEKVLDSESKRKSLSKIRHIQEEDLNSDSKRTSLSRIRHIQEEDLEIEKDLDSDSKRTSLSRIRHIEEEDLKLEKDLISFLSNRSPVNKEDANSPPASLDRYSIKSKQKSDLHYQKNNFSPKTSVIIEEDVCPNCGNDKASVKQVENRIKTHDSYPVPFEKNVEKKKNKSRSKSTSITIPSPFGEDVQKEKSKSRSKSTSITIPSPFGEDVQNEKNKRRSKSSDITIPSPFGKDVQKEKDKSRSKSSNITIPSPFGKDVQKEKDKSRSKSSNITIPISFGKKNQKDISETKSISSDTSHSTLSGKIVEKDINESRSKSSDTSHSVPFGKKLQEDRSKISSKSYDASLPIPSGKQVLDEQIGSKSSDSTQEEDDVHSKMNEYVVIDEMIISVEEETSSSSENVKESIDKNLPEKRRRSLQYSNEKDTKNGSKLTLRKGSLKVYADKIPSEHLEKIKKSIQRKEKDLQNESKSTLRRGSLKIYKDKDPSENLLENRRKSMQSSKEKDAQKSKSSQLLLVVNHHTASSEIRKNEEKKKKKHCKGKNPKEVTLTIKKCSSASSNDSHYKFVTHDDSRSDDEDGKGNKKNKGEMDKELNFLNAKRHEIYNRFLSQMGRFQCEQEKILECCAKCQTKQNDISDVVKSTVALLNQIENNQIRNCCNNFNNPYFQNNQYNHLRSHVYSKLLSAVENVYRQSYYPKCYQDYNRLQCIVQEMRNTLEELFRIENGGCYVPQYQCNSPCYYYYCNPCRNPVNEMQYAMADLSRLEEKENYLRNSSEYPDFRKRGGISYDLFYQGPKTGNGHRQNYGPWNR